ncbi:serine hydrolase [Streptomyces polyrhachis]|uniref:Serine hydrolase n=1 Tax=Streptomyces polyrhachis TaxID=1282885 RepID=A0ABW2GIQ3_9ACTN
MRKVPAWRAPAGRGTWRPAAAVSLLAVAAALTASGSPASGSTATPVPAPRAVLAAPDAPAARALPPQAADRHATPVRAPDPAKAVRGALDALGPHAGRYTLAVQDLDTGARAVYGARTGTYDTASIVKVDILAALLLRGERDGAALTAVQRQWASAMIRSSDNEATDRLWSVLGGPQALDRANGTLGLGATTAGGWGTWGLTQTTAADQLTLLRAVFAEDSPLSGESRRYVASLMGAIVPGQDWGVTAAGPGAPRVLKNGWLMRSRTKLWDVNSIGVVERDGHRLLLSVLTADQPTREDGIALVEQAASAAVRALVETSPPTA